MPTGIFFSSYESYRMKTSLRALSVTLLAGVLLGAGPAKEPGVMKGRVTDSAGNPLAGAQVVADNTLLYNSNAIAVSDAKGYYRVDVSRPAGTWNATAQLKRQVGGKPFTFDLHPDNSQVFAGTDGAVRNFTWKLRGKRPDGGNYGSPVLVYGDLGNSFWLDTTKVELTLEPLGPLADGSPGQTIVAKIVQTPDGDAVPDVPLARYAISGRYLDPERGALPLQIRKRNTESYATRAELDFEAQMAGVNRIEVDVRTP